MDRVKLHKVPLHVLVLSCRASWQHPPAEFCLSDLSCDQQLRTHQSRPGCCRLSPLLTLPSIACNSKPFKGFDMLACNRVHCWSLQGQPQNASPTHLQRLQG